MCVVNNPCASWRCFMMKVSFSWVASYCYCIVPYSKLCFFKSCNVSKAGCKPQHWDKFQCTIQPDHNKRICLDVRTTVYRSNAMFKLPGTNTHKPQTNHCSGHACSSHYLRMREMVHEEKKFGKFCAGQKRGNYNKSWLCERREMKIDWMSNSEMNRGLEWIGFSFVLSTEE